MLDSPPMQLLDVLLYSFYSACAIVAAVAIIIPIKSAKVRLFEAKVKNRVTFVIICFWLFHFLTSGFGYEKRKADRKRLYHRQNLLARNSYILLSH